METFGALLGKLTALMVLAALPIGTLWVCWGTLEAIIGGAADRAVQTLVVRAIVVGVLIAALVHLPDTMALLTGLGGVIFQTVFDAIREAV